MNVQFFASFSRQANVQDFARSFTQGGGVATLLLPCYHLFARGGYAAKLELARASAFVATVATYIFKGSRLEGVVLDGYTGKGEEGVLVKIRGGYGSYTAPESGCSLSATGLRGVATSGSYIGRQLGGERA